MQLGVVGRRRFHSDWTAKSVLVQRGDRLARQILYIKAVFKPISKDLSRWILALSRSVGDRGLTPQKFFAIYIHADIISV